MIIIVGQPILAAAGFQPAFTKREGKSPQTGVLRRLCNSQTREAPKRRLERRLQARLPAPQRSGASHA
jgi:hypothetical protein